MVNNSQLLSEVDDILRIAGFQDFVGPAPILEALNRELPPSVVIGPEPVHCFAEVAPLGPDRKRVSDLLGKCKRKGMGVLRKLCTKALKRTLRSAVHPVFSKSFFNQREKKELAKAIASWTSTAELMARSAVRRRQEQARKRHGDLEPAKFAEHTPYRVRKINATEFRARSLETQEFGMWATAYDFPDIIPPGEIWVDDQANDIDIPYWILNAEHVRVAHYKGLDQDDAYDYGLAAERSERQRVTHGGHGNEPFHKQVIPSVYGALWKVIDLGGEKVKVFFVNGTRVRESYKTDWWGGGHAFVYPFIPTDEIWIEYQMRPQEWELTLIHESNERTLMVQERKGYDDSHEDSSVLEFSNRRQAVARFDEFDAEKHPRGGNPENKGQFSKTAGGGKSDDSSRPSAKGDDFSWEKTATPKQKEALKEYTSESNSFVEINDCLRHPGSEGCDDAKLKEWTKDIQEVFDSAPEWEKPKTVYRGINLPPDGEDWKQLKAQFENASKTGALVTMRGFTSTSSGIYQASHFGEAALLTIEAKKGINLWHVSDLGEGEILLPNNCQYKVTSMERERVPYSSPPAYRTAISLEQVLGEGGCFAEDQPDEPREKPDKRHRFAVDDPAEFSFEEDVEAFGEWPVNLEIFRETKAPGPMIPRRAVEYFQRLVPKLRVDPVRFGKAHERDAFTAAEATNKEILDKMHRVIANRLETGKGITSAPHDIEGILEDAGIHPRNPQYAEMVVRTNMMDAYNTGTVKEMQEKDVQEDFPVWRYLGVKDGRQGEDHEPHFGKYYSSEVSFNEVRDSLIVKNGEVTDSRGKGRPYNCRCSPQPIYKRDWEKLTANGARITPWPEKFSEKMARLEAFVEFDPGKHPRGGNPENAGQFSKGEGSGAKKEKPAPATKEAEAELESYMDEMMPKLDKEVEDAEGEDVEMAGGGSWDDLTESAQAKAEENYIKSAWDSEEQFQQEQWAEDAKQEVEDSGFAYEYWDKWADENGLPPSAKTEAPTWKDHKLVISAKDLFRDDSKIPPIGTEGSLSDVERWTLIGEQNKKGEDWWEEHKDQWEEDFEKAKDDEVEKKVDNAPDFSDQIQESLADSFSQMDDDQKKTYVDSDDEDSASSKSVEIPSKWKIFRNGKDYERTQSVALYLQQKRAEELIHERIKDKCDGCHVDVPKLSNLIWTRWKASSTNSIGVALQKAAAEELNGHYRQPKNSDPDDGFLDIAHNENVYVKQWTRQDMYDILKKAIDSGKLHSKIRGRPESKPKRDGEELLKQMDIELKDKSYDKTWSVTDQMVQDFLKDNGYSQRSEEFGKEILKAYVRATWEASQYIMRKAGIKDFVTYRGIMLDGNELEKEKREQVSEPGTVDSVTRLPGLKLLRNGAASTTANATVANDWGGVGEKPPNARRVVLRIKSPRTAVLSAPVFGQNLHNEEEIVLAGTNWESWDAWLNRAPDWDVPFSASGDTPKDASPGGASSPEKANEPPP